MPEDEKYKFFNIFSDAMVVNIVQMLLYNVVLTTHSDISVIRSAQISEKPNNIKSIRKGSNKGNNKVTEQSYKGKVKTHNYIDRQNQSTTGKL